jgi:hypothetical protein
MSRVEGDILGCSVSAGGTGNIQSIDHLAVCILPEQFPGVEGLNEVQVMPHVL